MKAYLILIIVCCIGGLGFNANAKAETADGRLIKVDSWKLNLAVGVGKRNNVSLGGADSNLYIVPSIKYYGEKLFFDNGSLGYTLMDRPNFALSLVTEFNPTLAWFYDGHPGNLLIDTGTSESFVADAPGQDRNDKVDASDDPEPNTGIDDSPDTPVVGDEGNSGDQNKQPQSQTIEFKRPSWSLDLGLQGNWFISNRQGLLVQVFTDASNLHQGNRLELDWFYKNQFKVAQRSFGWQVNLGTRWLDSKSANYYFGVEQESTPIYQAESGFVPTASVKVSTRINNNWSAVWYYKYQKLDKTFANSPKIVDNQVHTYFVGVSYGF